jgi:hypothetical protein
MHITARAGSLLPLAALRYSALPLAAAKEKDPVVSQHRAPG